MKKGFDKLNDVKNNLEDIEEVKLSVEEKTEMKKRALKNIKEFKKEEEKQKSENNKKKLLKGLAVACLGLVICTNETVIAGAQKLGSSIESFFEKEESSFKKYKKTIIKEVEDKGIKFSLYEAMLDEEVLYIASSIDYSQYKDDKLDGKEFSVIPNDMYTTMISENGKELEVNGNGASFEYDNENKIVNMLLKVRSDEMDINQNFDINIELGKLTVQIPGEKHQWIEGNWNIEFTVDGKALAENRKVIKINKEINLEEKGKKEIFNVEELILTDTSMTLKYKDKYTPIYETAEERDKNVLYGGFKFYDENNKEIYFGGGQSGDDCRERWVIDREIKKLKIVPVSYKTYKDNISVSKEFKDKAIEIDLTK